MQKRQAQLERARLEIELLNMPMGEFMTIIEVANGIMRIFQPTTDGKAE